MPTINRTKTRVFLSYAASDRIRAATLQKRLTEAGLEVTSSENFVSPGGSYTAAMRSALRQSQAVFVLLGGIEGDAVPSGLVFEIGVAAGAGKPIYVLTNSERLSLPFDIANLRLVPLQRVDDLIRQVETMADCEH